MPIVVNLNIMMALRRKRVIDLVDKKIINQPYLAALKNGRAKQIRFPILENLCKELDCQPGDILEYIPDKEDK